MLISMTLAFLGVPLWMILGMLILIFWNRSKVKKQPGIFPVKLRPEAGPDAEKEPKWSRTGYAQWVHDVLIVRQGLGLMQTIPYGISALEGPVQDADPDKVKGLGEHPKVMQARLDDDSILQVAVGELHPQLAPERFLAGRAQDVPEEIQK